jgi:hypothetical protein
MPAKHLYRKNIMVFFNTMVLPQNFRNILFPSTPLVVNFHLVRLVSYSIHKKDLSLDNSN